MVRWLGHKISQTTGFVGWLKKGQTRELQGHECSQPVRPNATEKVDTGYDKKVSKPSALNLAMQEARQSALCWLLMFAQSIYNGHTHPPEVLWQRKAYAGGFNVMADLHTLV